MDIKEAKKLCVEDIRSGVLRGSSEVTADTLEKSQRVSQWLDLVATDAEVDEFERMTQAISDFSSVTPWECVQEWCTFLNALLGDQEEQFPN